jgi:hypothetical protein
MDYNILKVYKLLLDNYRAIINESLNTLQENNWKIEAPKVMFPPLPGADFSAQCAEAGFLRHDCGILTAFRSNRRKKDNIIENLKLEKQLQEHSIKYIEVIGWFKESISKKPSKEDSFFVFDDGPESTSSFFEKIYVLSKTFEQDCFLFKKAGFSRTAFLINTNEESQRREREKAIKEGKESTGDISEAGQLYLNFPLGIQKPATKTDKGHFAFLKTPPTPESFA